MISVQVRAHAFLKVLNFELFKENQQEHWVLGTCVEKNWATPATILPLVSRGACPLARKNSGHIVCLCEKRHQRNNRRIEGERRERYRKRRMKVESQSGGRGALCYVTADSSLVHRWDLRRPWNSQQRDPVAPNLDREMLRKCRKNVDSLDQRSEVDCISPGSWLAPTLVFSSLTHPFLCLRRILLWSVDCEKCRETVPRWLPALRSPS